MKTRRSGERERRRSRPEYGIDEHADAVDLNQERAVSEPRDSQTGLRRRRPHRTRIVDWNGDPRAALPPAEQKIAPDRQHISLKLRAHTAGVVEAPVTKLRRREHSFAPLHV